jgi:hypothetical protein
MATMTSNFLISSRSNGASVGKQLEIVNLVGRGFPAPETVGRDLDRVIRCSRRAKVRALKLIHGYGSNGTVELLRFAIRVHLHGRTRRGRIGMYVNGENWSRSDEASRELLRHVPESIIDSDLDRGNRGITLVLL